MADRLIDTVLRMVRSNAAALDSLRKLIRAMDARLHDIEDRLAALESGDGIEPTAGHGDPCSTCGKWVSGQPRNCDVGECPFSLVRPL